MRPKGPIVLRKLKMHLIRCRTHDAPALFALGSDIAAFLVNGADASALLTTLVLRCSLV